MKKIILFVLLLPFMLQANVESTTLEMHPITKNIYQHISYLDVPPWGRVAANGLVAVIEQDAYIIDTPWTIADTKQLVAWIKAQGLTPKAAVISHFHQDASNGIAYLNEVGIDTYASTLTNSLLAKQNLPQSNISYSDQSLTIANGTIEIFAPGAGHSSDNIVVWFAQQKMLFGGCFVKSLESTSLGNIADASIDSWSISINNVLKKYPEIKQVVPGHGKIGDVSLLAHTAKLVSKQAHRTH
ncbi:subclass B1 metallo-beta-lactamase [Pseudoalteromonas sp. T1lg23B]|uniref:subclass B1 metallo-beta-lactamase n=1 Tax=Pseudoalteromonas sp. T1lg23B TaxID=2077097 RepID=UPI000CF6D5CA|nr:subclass B1 metallo-beta-lactamase [Pseudoalteromonas sp. T1lg23B]